MTTDQPNESKVLKVLQLLKRHNSPDPDDLQSLPSLGEGEILIRKLTELFGKAFEIVFRKSWDEVIVFLSNT